jgi:hypothetical protein
MKTPTYDMTNIIMNEELNHLRVYTACITFQKDDLEGCEYYPFMEDMGFNSIHIVEENEDEVCFDCFLILSDRVKNVEEYWNAAVKEFYNCL